MAKWRVVLELEEDLVREYWEQQPADAATTSSDVRDLVNDAFRDAFDDINTSAGDEPGYKVIEASRTTEE